MPDYVCLVAGRQPRLQWRTGRTRFPRFGTRHPRCCGSHSTEAQARLELMLTGQLSNGGAIPVIKPFEHNPGHELPPADEEYRSDDCLWFFNAVPAMVGETGDFDFYNKVLPYADGEDTVLDICGGRSTLTWSAWVATIYRAAYRPVE